MRLGLVVFILYCLFATALSADGDTSSTTTESSSTTTTESSTTTTTESSTTTTTTIESDGTTTTESDGTTTTVSGGTTTTVSGGTTTTVSGGTTTTVSGGTTTTGPTTTTITTTSTTTTSAAQALIRKTVWLVGDPHLYSVKNNYQFCNFTGLQTCLSTTGLSIDCTAANVKSDGSTPVTYLSSLSLTFTNSTTKTYTANDPTVALTDKFSDGSSAALSSANTTWLVLTMLTNTSKSSSVSIVDYQTNTTIVISQWRNSASTYKMYNLIVRMTSKDFSTSSGILINGCPGSSRRRRRSLSSLTDQERDASDACAGMSNSGDINSADICVADTTATGDSSFADATSIAAQSIQSAVSIDASSFSAAVSSFNLGVNLALFSIALNIFLFFY